MLDIVAETVTEIAIADVRFVKELYPRLKEDDAAIERYRDALEKLPPIVVARDGILVDGFHRWQAHRREARTTITVLNLGNLSDTEILNESIRRNASHGQQLSRGDKKRLAGVLWAKTGHLDKAERYAHLEELLAVSRRSLEAWTKDARKEEKKEQQAKAWDAWLDCRSERDIGDEMGLPRDTVHTWLVEKRKDAEFNQPPASRQDWDVWLFATDADDERATYFGKTPKQVLENLLWFYTEPGAVVFDPFAGSGTTIRVAKEMGRRVWSSDVVPSTPTLPIHEHDITAGWPADAPKRADFVYLDPPYFEQARGRYPKHERQMGELADYGEWLEFWSGVVKTCAAGLSKGGHLAYIVSPAKMPGSGGQMIDLAFDMYRPCIEAGLKPARRIVVPYSTQQATGDQVNKARDAKQMLVRLRDVVVFSA